MMGYDLKDFDPIDDWSVSWKEDLVGYLLDHEYEIFIDENDFGKLLNVFKVLMNRDPK